MTRVKLTKKAVRVLRRPLVGSGGFQTLLRQLQAGLQPDGTLLLTRKVAEKVYRYRMAYGQGGFQNRLGVIASSRIRRATWRPE